MDALYILVCGTSLQMLQHDVTYEILLFQNLTAWNNSTNFSPALWWKCSHNGGLLYVPPSLVLRIVNKQDFVGFS